MDLESSPLWPDIKRIQQFKENQSRYKFKAILHTPKKNINTILMSNLQIDRDYVHNFCEYRYIEVMLALGDYVYDVCPYRSNLELALQREVLLPGGASSSLERLEVDRYKVVFLDITPILESVEYTHYSQRELNTMNVLTFWVQLIDKRSEQLRLQTVQGAYSNVKMENLITSILYSKSKEIKVEGKPAVDGVDIVPPNNKTTYKQISFRSQFPIDAVPSYLQERSFGVYNGGIGTFYQAYHRKRYWFVYPLFDKTQFKKSVRKLIIISAPRQRLLITDRTYRLDGNVLYILASGEKKLQDPSEAMFMDKGVGFRMTDASSMMKKPVVVTDKGVYAKQNRLNHEVVAKQRDDGINYAPMSDREISSNIYAQLSQVLLRTAKQMTLTWYHSNYDHIYPGMPCEYRYVEDNKIKIMEGSVLHHQILIQPESNGVLNPNHITTSSLVLFLNDQTPKGGSNG